MRLKLVVIGGKRAGMEIPISMPKCAIGRGEDCQIRLQSQCVSRTHCVISLDNGLVAIEDCDSANGTLVNGESIRQRRGLENGDRITIGTLELEVRLAGDEAKEQKQRVRQPRVERNPPLRTGKPTPRIPRGDVLDCEASLLEWLDGAGNGQPVTPSLAKKSTTDARKRPPKKADEVAESSALPSAPASVADVGNSDRVAAELLDLLDVLPHDSARQVSDPSFDRSAHNENAVHGRRIGSQTLDAAGSGDVEHYLASNPHPLPYSEPGEQLLASCEDVATVCLDNGQAKTEWDGTALLLLAAIGLLLVVLLSWLFPMSWPEGKLGASESLMWWWENWWQIWWLRLGAVAVLVAGLPALLKLRSIRAQSEEGY